MKVAFNDQRAEINTIVQAGLEARTDEIQRALIAGQGTGQWYYVQVANVPAESQTFEDLKGLALNFAQPAIMQFGDTVAFDFYVPTLDDPKASALQAILEKAKGSGVLTAITISAPPGQ